VATNQILLGLVPDGGGLPFAHPAIWTTFMLLGDAPVLPPLQTSARLHSDTKRAHSRIWGWLKGLFSRK
jgi:hypothetical protein